MRNLLFTLFLFMLCVTIAMANPGAGNPSNPRLTVDSTGNLVSTTNPLPVAGTVAVTGEVTATAAVPDANSTTIVSVTASAANVASLANRKSFTVVNTSATETLWVSLDSVTASAAANVSIPIYPYGFKSDDLAAGKIIGLYSATPLTAIVYQNAVTP